ncbi:MAG: RNA polymerase sigma factor [Candidatus Promineifilaceae bacterium]
MSLSYDCQQLYYHCQNEAHQEEAYTVLWRLVYRTIFPMTRSMRDGDAFTEDCAQETLIRVHAKINQCKDPAKFCGWVRIIARRVTLNKLAARKPSTDLDAIEPPESAEPPPHQQIVLDQFWQLVAAAPISSRSRRVVEGRYRFQKKDKELAAAEMMLTNDEVRPSHIQVTRAKNIKKMRNDNGLRFLGFSP